MYVRNHVAFSLAQNLLSYKPSVFENFPVSEGSSELIYWRQL
jgi:hypothetical protein